ncbi:outer membrane protein transport protein [Crocinitomix catalasitica]|nr:outer membrane protein transport protein [Crocinitomix catalasitica]
MKKSLLIVLFSISCSAFAGGFQLNVQSVRAIGLGGAYTGFAYGPASVFFNPGGMSSLKGHNLCFGINLVFPTVSLQTLATENIDQTSGIATPFHFYYGGELIPNKLYVGLAINNLFGSSSSFADDWEGRFIVQNISLKTFSFQPTAAYKIHDMITVGAGFVFTAANFGFEKAVPLGTDTSDYGKASLSGRGLAFGFNGGFLFSPLKVDSGKIGLSLGSSFRSGQSINLADGIATFTNIPSSLLTTFPSSTNFTGGLNLPYVITAGFAVELNLSEMMGKEAGNVLRILYDFNYTGWQSYDSLKFDFVNEDTPDGETPKLWQNVPTHRFGIELQIRNLIFLRAGGYYDFTPIKDLGTGVIDSDGNEIFEGFVSPELPDADQFVPTVGIGILLKEKFAFDISWIHQDASRTADLTSAGWSASYRRIADVISFSASYKF